MRRFVAINLEPAVRSGRIETSLSEFGAFPNFRRPHVVWIGMDADPRLEMLHHDVEVACDALGFPVDGRPFRPHVTLARVKRDVDATTRRTLMREARTVDGMGSTLHPEGARHELLHSSPLREL